MDKIRYNHLNSHLKNIHGERVLKICVDGFFTCPNRDGKCSFGGCIFCGEKGSGDNLFAINKIGKSDERFLSIRNQIEYFLDSYKGERANKFIIYFQNFSNTYDSIENLKRCYDTALSVSDKIIGLSVATRVDCIDEDIAKLLSSYKDKYAVSVELGLQTASNKIGKVINRGFDTSQFIEAVNILHKYEIEVVAHVMIGLPGECEKDIKDTINLINTCKCEGVKIHSTFVLKDTVLEDMLNNKDYDPITLEYYIDKIGKIISNLNKDIVIHRITGDPPKQLLIEPLWTGRKKVVINAINNYLKEKDIVQGDKKENFM